MPTTTSHASHAEPLLSPSDIYDAAREGVLAQADAERLVRWGYGRRFGRHLMDESTSLLPERPQGLNAVAVAYYIGALLMITSCAWLLGEKWDALGPSHIFILVLVYALVVSRIGWQLRRRGFAVGGGLLLSVAVCLVPLLTYTVEDMSGLWLGGRPPGYMYYYVLPHRSWVVMEAATIIAAAVMIGRVHFSFLTAPLAFSCWLLARDLGVWIGHDSSTAMVQRLQIGMVVGLLTLIIGRTLEQRMNKFARPGSEDMAFWCYLFGLLAFWNALTALTTGPGSNYLLYALVNAGLVGIGVRLRRATFLVFGALGLHLYIVHLAYEVFPGAFLFPFVLALLGAGIISVTIKMQSRRRGRQDHAQ